MANLAEPYPPVTSVLFKSNAGKAPSLIAWHQITEIQDHLLAHLLLPEDFREPSLSDDELLLKDTLLDKQIVDTNGAKVRRVNDLQFLKARKGLHLVHVDVGFRGLMRRVGMEKAMDTFLHGLFDYSLPDQFISWKFVQPLVSPDLLRLKITQNRLAQLHPADLADIIEELDINQRTAVFQSLDVETAAETLEETDPKIQVSLIEDLDAAEASDIIEEMSLSDATDLLQDLPQGYGRRHPQRNGTGKCGRYYRTAGPPRGNSRRSDDNRFSEFYPIRHDRRDDQSDSRRSGRHGSYLLCLRNG